MTTNIMIPLSYVDSENSDVSNTTLFQLLCNDSYTQDSFLSKALYMMMKVVESKSFRQTFTLTMLHCCITLYGMEKGLCNKDVIFDSGSHVSCFFMKDFLDKPDFYEAFDVSDIRQLIHMAKGVGIKELKPKSMPQSLWIIISGFYENMRKLKQDSGFIPDNYSSFIKVMEYMDIETADFFEACFAAIFYYPSFVNNKSRRAIEYWIQRAMLEAGLGHIDWRQSLRDINMPLFGLPEC